MHGISIILYEKTEAGMDPFGKPIYTEAPLVVENVLIGEPSNEDIVDALNLYGKRVAYTLGIPKGDLHTWEDSTVEFFGQRFRTIGFPTQGIEELIPLAWNKKVKVERYE